MNTLEAIHQSKIPEKVIAGGTVIVGTSVLLDFTTGLFALIATFLGIILTALLIYKTSITIRKEKMSREQAQLELDHARNRRKTDKVE